MLGEIKNDGDKGYKRKKDEQIITHSPFVYSPSTVNALFQ